MTNRHQVLGLDMQIVIAAYNALKEMPKETAPESIDPFIRFVGLYMEGCHYHPRDGWANLSSILTELTEAEREWINSVPALHGFVAEIFRLHVADIGY